MGEEQALRVLMIGAGGVAANQHLKGYQAYPDLAKIVAIADPSKTARSAIADRLEYKVEEFENHTDALSTVATRIDACVVLTPHWLHFQHCMDCVAHGLPVLVEKPAVMNLEEGLRLADAADRKGVAVVAGQTRRHLPQLQFLHDWMHDDSSQFGAISSFEVTAWQNVLAWIASKPNVDKNHWILDGRRAGGGVTISLGCHYLDLVRYLTGEDFAQVSARGVFEAPFTNGAESACCAWLQLENGAVGTFNGNYLARRVPYNESIKLFGTQGSVIQHLADWGKGTGEFRFGPQTSTQLSAFADQFRDLEPVPGTDGESNAMTRQLLSFRDVVQKGATSIASISDNLNTIAALDAIQRSIHQGGQPVEVSHRRSRISQ